MRFVILGVGCEKMAIKKADAARGEENLANNADGAGAAADREKKKTVKKETGVVKAAPKAAAKAKPAKTQGKKGIFQRIGQYFKEVVAELKKVHWPTRRELMTYTGVVLASVGILAVLTWIVDSGLSYVLIELLGR